MRVILFFLLFCTATTQGQKMNAVWCFGDSSGIDFNSLNIPIPKFTCMDGRGSCVSVCDTSGMLLFYGYTQANLGGPTTMVRSGNDSIMQNGDGIIGRGWYHELSIIPDPSNTNLYYLFSVGVTGQPGLFYSVIDMSINSGRGKVVQKNIQLLSNQMCDGLQTVKHGNGRDWWLFCHPFDSVNNNYIRYLISPLGIIGPDILNYGDLTITNLLNINFSKDGNKVAIINYNDLLEIYDFDRCTGTFSNLKTIRIQHSFPPFSWLWSCEFSPNNEILYVSTNETDSYFLQIDLMDSIPWVTRDTLWIQDSIKYSGGQVELGPDDKIYFSCSWSDGYHFNYPYPDSAFYFENMNLGVVNDPNIRGTACDFQPYGYYLGGKRTYIGLPNNPIYELGAVTSSLCDSLSSVNEVTVPQEKLTVYYNSSSQKCFINASGLKESKCVLEIVDAAGKKIFSEVGIAHGGFYSKEFDIRDYSNNVYLVSLTFQNQNRVTKFIKD